MTREGLWVDFLEREVEADWNSILWVLIQGHKQTFDWHEEATEEVHWNLIREEISL